LAAELNVKKTLVNEERLLKLPVFHLVLFGFLMFHTVSFAVEKINYDAGFRKVQEFAKTRDFKNAGGLLKEMLSQYPDNSELLHTLARIFYWEKRFDESIEVYQRLMQVKPSDEAQEDFNRVFLAKKLQSAEELKSGGRLKEAEEVLNGIYQAGEDKYTAGYHLGLLYIKQREYKEALRIFSELRGRYPEDTGFEELYLESLVLAGEIDKAKEGLASLPEPRREKLYSAREDLFYRTRKSYLKLSMSAVDYTLGIEDERQYEIQLGQRLKGRPFIFTYSSIERFGEKDGQAGLEIYSKSGEGTRRWGYVFLTAGMKAAFLPRWTAGAYIYQGHGGFDFSLGYSHMEFRDTSVNMLIPGAIAYLPYGLSITETLPVNLKDSSTGLISKLSYEPDHKFKCFYSYSFGKSAEEVGSLQDIEKIDNYTHTAGAEYRIREYVGLGAEYKYSSRENSYTQKGATIFTKVWW